jgi:hypothetical protein
MSILVPYCGCVKVCLGSARILLSNSDSVGSCISPTIVIDTSQPSCSPLRARETKISSAPPMIQTLPRRILPLPSCLCLVRPLSLSVN